MNRCKAPRRPGVCSIGLVPDLTGARSVPEALSGLNRVRLMREAPAPEDAMAAAARWVNGLRERGRSKC